MPASVPLISLPEHYSADAKYDIPLPHPEEIVGSRNSHYRHVLTYNPFHNPIVSSTLLAHYEDVTERANYRFHAPSPKHH